MRGIQNSKFKIFNFTLSLLTLHFALLIWFVPTISAVDSTPSADIRIKLEQLKIEIASKAAKLKQEIDRKLKNKAYVGKVKTKSASSITLATKNGPRIVNINQDSEFESQIQGLLREASKKFSQKSLSEEDYVAALGDVDEQDVLTAKKLILLPASPAGGTAPDSIPKTYLWGQILSISDKLMTLKNNNSKNIAISLSNPSQVRTNDFVILTGFLGKNDIFKAQFVYVIPQGGVIKPKKIATPSAQIATKSATTSATKK